MASLGDKSWATIHKILDAALDADATQADVLEVGLHAVQFLVESHIVAPPTSRSSEQDERAEPAARIVLRIPSSAADDRERIQALVDDIPADIERRTGFRPQPVTVMPDPELEAPVIAFDDMPMRDTTMDDDDAYAAVTAVYTEVLPELLDREKTAEIVDIARRTSPMVVQELVPNSLSLGQLRQILRNLLAEGVPIRRMSTILNALADNSVYTKDPYALTEHVRAALGREICARFQSPEGAIKAFMLGSDAERAIQNSIQLNETGQVLMLDPNTSHAIHNNLADAIRRHQDKLVVPVIVTPPKIRRHVASMLERNFSQIVVLSHSEIVRGVAVDELDVVGADWFGESVDGTDGQDGDSWLDG
ncbi:MAG: FHIPEP family type III secretion protein [Thermoleophilia bacterium]|nr:FHIPEP family type III secretion protein [Thermoleophilia bacterium]